MGQIITNEEHSKYVGQSISDIDDLRKYFSKNDLKIINKYGAWMEALSEGILQPITKDQKRFIDFSNGGVKPKNEYEEIWIKILNARKIFSNENKEARRKIHIFSAICSFVAIQPIPFADIFILTPIQFVMAERLANTRNIPLSKSSKSEVILDLFKIIGLGLIAQQIALGLYKFILPFLAGFTTIPLVYGLTYAIGRTVDYMYLQRSKGADLSPEEIKNIWETVKKENKQN